MKKVLKMGLFAPILLFSILLQLNASFILKNENILPKKTADKIEEMGSELQKKTGVGVYLIAVKDLNSTDIIEYEKNVSKNLKSPFILLTISLNDKKIDIINSKELDDKFDKEQILSPWPWSGSILPLLTAKSKNPKANVEAALLNGYADIVEQIASSYNVELKSAIGSQNKIVYEILKLFFYGMLFIIFVKFIYGRVKKNE